MATPKPATKKRVPAGHSLRSKSKAAPAAASSETAVATTAAKAASEAKDPVAQTNAEQPAQQQAQANPEPPPNSISLGPDSMGTYPYQFTFTYFGGETGGDLYRVTTIMDQREFTTVNNLLNRAFSETEMFMGMGQKAAHELLATRSALQLTATPESKKAYIQNISKLPTFSLNLDFVSTGAGLPPADVPVNLLYKGMIWNGRLYGSQATEENPPTEFAIETPDSQAFFVKIAEVTAWAPIP